MNAYGRASYCEGQRRELPTAGVLRQTVELLVVLCLCVLLVRTFAAEAYVVPTGSMAPTLLGHHREVTCPNCRFVFVVGIDDEGNVGRAVCPNCGEHDLSQAASLECGGDRVLVQKFVYEFRRPMRWEVAVFHFPGEPVQAYVKRVVGLPGEAVQISGGDVYINGQIMRKSLSEVRATRILVHDSRFQPQDAGRFPRWRFRRDGRYLPRSSGWSQEDDRFLHHAVEASGMPDDDWLIYRHWDPARRQYGAVTDFYGYNGNELRGENDVTDLAVEAVLTVSDSVQSLSVALVSGPERFVVKIPAGPQGKIELYRNDRRVPLSNCENPLKKSGAWPRTVTLEAAVFDRRLQVALDGELLFDPIDYDREMIEGPQKNEDPVALGVRGGTLAVSELRIYRDIYYTGTLAGTPRQPHDMKSAVHLGHDEYFVLGDNSPVSNDSRFWTEGPVVPGSMFVGKPFLVHLPGQVVPLQVFGRSVCWVPDPRRIRYIR